MGSKCFQPDWPGKDGHRQGGDGGHALDVRGPAHPGHLVKDEPVGGEGGGLVAPGGQHAAGVQPHLEFNRQENLYLDCKKI